MLLAIIATLGTASAASNCPEYVANPENYHRDPCPDTRPESRCNALDEYVWRRDPNYKWHVVETYDQYPNVIGYSVMLESQQWLDESIYYIQKYGPGSVVWKHWVNVWVPRGKVLDKDLLDSAILFVDGESQKDNPPSQDDLFVQIGRFLSATTGLAYVNIKQIPNERLCFLNDWKDSRSEDSIIAITWRHFLDYPDQPEWLLRFPMVKASIRAMDMATELIAQKHPDRLPLTKWAVAGASKRGWTSWLVAAVDPERIKAMAPMVLDLLNMKDNFRHMYQNTGNWTFTMYDYWLEGINGRIDEPEMEQMMDLIDPYAYRKRLTMPKMIISSTGDEFFMPDDSHTFWSGLPEPKYLRLLANAEHSTTLSWLSAPHFAFSFRQFLLASLKGYPLPDMKWTRYDDAEKKTGGIELITNTPVKEIYGWVGDTRNDFRRDFRLVGLEDNHLGYYEMPDYPNEPPGYPDKAPQGVDTSSYRTVSEKKQDIGLKLVDEIDCELIESEFCHFRKNESNFLDISIDQLLTQKTFNPSWELPFVPRRDGVQVQTNFWRRVMATQVAPNRWRLEFNEASNAFRGFFFQVAFQGPDDMQGFEFTSEIQVIPTKPPFDACYGSDCQGALI